MPTEKSSPDLTARAQIEQLLAERQASRRRELPGWVPVAMKALPYTLIAATVINGFIGMLAALTPFIAAWSAGAADVIYTAYSYICPQRPSHTFFLNGHPMAFEHRDLSMHLGFAVAGVLYATGRWLRRPLPGWALALGVTPMLVDVGLSTFDILPATWFSRTWTGALASFAIVWWVYPRFEGYLEKVKRHVDELSN